jgi:hypothetical protein
LRPSRRGTGLLPIDPEEGKCFLDMLGVFAEFETSLRRERHSERFAQVKPSACLDIAPTIWSDRPRHFAAAVKKTRRVMHVLGSTAVVFFCWSSSSAGPLLLLVLGGGYSGIPKRHCLPTQYARTQFTLVRELTALLSRNRSDSGIFSAERTYFWRIMMCT